MLGLSNLYYIDPEDREIAAELLEFRLKFVEIIQSCPEGELESLWGTDQGALLPFCSFQCKMNRYLIKMKLQNP